MPRREAERRCDLDPACRGLHFYSHNGGDGRAAQSGWYQGCGGDAAKQANRHWDTILKPKCLPPGKPSGVAIEASSGQPKGKRPPGKPNRSMAMTPPPSTAAKKAGGSQRKPARWSPGSSSHQTDSSDNRGGAPVAGRKRPSTAANGAQPALLPQGRWASSPGGNAQRGRELPASGGKGGRNVGSPPPVVPTPGRKTDHAKTTINGKPVAGAALLQSAEVILADVPCRFGPRIWRTAEVMSGRRCSQELWHGGWSMKRVDAEVRCEKDALCLGLQFFRKRHDEDGRFVDGGGYQGCGGVAGVLTRSQWDVLLKPRCPEDPKSKSPGFRVRSTYTTTSLTAQSSMARSQVVVAPLVGKVAPTDLAGRRPNSTTNVTPPSMNKSQIINASIAGNNAPLNNLASGASSSATTPTTTTPSTTISTTIARGVIVQGNVPIEFVFDGVNYSHLVESLGSREAFEDTVRWSILSAIDGAHAPLLGPITIELSSANVGVSVHVMIRVNTTIASRRAELLMEGYSADAVGETAAGYVSVLEAMLRSPAHVEELTQELAGRLQEMELIQPAIENHIVGVRSLRIAQTSVEVKRILPSDADRPPGPEEGSGILTSDVSAGGALGAWGARHARDGAAIDDAAAATEDPSPYAEATATKAIFV